MSRTAISLLVLGFLAVSCGGGAATNAPAGPPSIPETCAVRLPPRLAPPAAPRPATFAAPRSTIVVNAEIPLAGLSKELEAKVPVRVAEERALDIGVGGHLEYTVDRGPFALHVENDSLVVETPLKGRAVACAKGRCYAGCDPELKATARVPLRLGADYRLHTSDVHIDVTKGCQIRTLGGLLTIDVTPALRSRLAQESKRVQASIDRELPNLAPQAARLWKELEAPHSLLLGACVVLEPEEITQGPASGTGSSAKLRFGLLARPEIRLRCGDAPKTRPLPPLRDDLALPALGDVHLALVLPADAPARSLTNGPALFDLGRGRARIRGATGDLASSVVLDLTGEACGDVAVAATSAAWLDPRNVHLGGVSLAPGEGERFAAAGLDAAGVARGVEASPIAVPFAAAELATILPELARGLSDEHTTISATVESSKPEAAGVRGAEILAVALLRGSISLQAK